MKRSLFKTLVSRCEMQKNAVELHLLESKVDGKCLPTRDYSSSFRCFQHVYKTIGLFIYLFSYLFIYFFDDTLNV